MDLTIDCESAGVKACSGRQVRVSMEKIDVNDLSSVMNEIVEAVGNSDVFEALSDDAIAEYARDYLGMVHEE